jgi:hypothetical protein
MTLPTTPTHASKTDIAGIPMLGAQRYAIRAVTEERMVLFNYWPRPSQSVWRPSQLTSTGGSGIIRSQ